MFMRLSALIFWRFSASKCSYFVLIFFETFLFINGDNSTWKVSKYGVFPGPYFPVFALITGIYSVNLPISANIRKYGPEKTPYLVTFHAVIITPIENISIPLKSGIKLYTPIKHTITLQNMTLTCSCHFIVS